MRELAGRAVRLGLSMVVAAAASAQVPTPEAPPLPTARPEAALATAPGAPVTVNGEELFRLVARLGPFTPAERAAAVSTRITELARSGDTGDVDVRVKDDGGAAEISAAGRVLMTVTDADAAAQGRSRDEVAAAWSRAIAGAIRGTRRVYSLKSLLLGVLFTVLATAVLVLFLRVQRRVLAAVTSRLDGWRDTRIPSLRIQRLELLTSSRITDALIGLAKLLRAALVVVALYFYLPLVFSFFPWTRGMARVLFGYIAAPLGAAWRAFIGYIPDLFVIIVGIAVTYYVVKLARLIFSEMEKGTVAVPGFERDWARPTFKIVRFLIIVFAVIVIFPYLPGAESPAFKGVSIFLGLLLSLGSTSAVANVIAGVILTYTKAFRVGDRVRIADTFGDVVEKTLLVTRVRTVKNVDITVPNAMVMGSHIVNYSTSAQRRGLILHTGVTIGYEVPWRRVHELLVDAAAGVEGVLADPPPFVLQTALDDFYVAYELNAYTTHPDRMARIYSDLHQAIQDGFAAAGVEIMSPHYAAVRDGHRAALPDEYLPEGYAPPGFRIGPAEVGGDTKPATRKAGRRPRSGRSASD